MQIPKTIKVGGLTYSVEVVESLGEGAVGRINYPQQSIKIEKAKEDFMLLTFWHEIFHAMNAEINEVQIEYMAQALTQFVRDNPNCFKEGGDLSGRKKKSRSARPIKSGKRTRSGESSGFHFEGVRKGCMEKSA
jgi:hypothetical protein